MADIKGTSRTTITGVGGKFISRIPGTQIGYQVNTFAMEKIKAAVNGETIANILLEAIQPAVDQVNLEWPVDTGASKDSLQVEIAETGNDHARVALLIGGERLMRDERNVSGKDYAPYIEFNGTPTTHPGTLTHAMVMNQDAMRDIIRARLSELFERAAQ